MERMRPGDFLVLAIGSAVSFAVVAVLASLADLEWLWVLALLGFIPAAALLVISCVGYGVAAGLLLREDQLDAASRPEAERT